MPIRQSRRCCAARDADAAVVEERAAAARGGEQVVAHRVVDHALRDHALVRQRDRHAILRKAVQEVGRAVERIDDPHVLGVGVRARGRCLPRRGSRGPDRRRAASRRSPLSAARSTSLTKSFGPLAVTVSRSRSRAPRLMMLPARRAAFTAVVSIGCMVWRRARVAAKGANRSVFYLRAPTLATRHRPMPDRPRRTPQRVADALLARAHRARAHEPSRQHRRRGARDADDGPDAARAGRARSASPTPTRRRSRPARRRCSIARDVVATLDEALAGCALTIGLSARPREFAGRVLPVREAAREAIARARATATSRWCSAPRCRA